ncbi:MAG: histidine kinase [Acidobacteriota bacterium]|nr:MAG: histidine kinase [Acidobacteriota bacterium]
MNQLEPALLINLLGFAVGVSLYAMLLVMVFRHRTDGKFNGLLFLTAVLGIVWNVGELLAFVWRDFQGSEIPPFLQAASFSALGFLPAAVFHTVRRNEGLPWPFVASAYGLSVFAAVLHFFSAVAYGTAPSIIAFQVLSAGSLILVTGLFLRRAWEGIENRAILITALLVFAFSAFHLSTDSEYDWWLLEMVAHHSSLPLVLAILLQDYRFAFADLYLKRALSILIIALFAFSAYVLALGPTFDLHSTHETNDPLAVGATLLFWIATASVYPLVQRFSNWLVDRIILKRADYAAFVDEISSGLESERDETRLMERLSGRIGDLFLAGRASFEAANESAALPDRIVEYSPEKATVRVVTDGGPDYVISLEGLAGARRLLSDESAMLEKLSVAAGRRIDSIRTERERTEREARERELARLTAEARLSALRSQINPHFLFNALTAIGHLIKVAPEVAFGTLMKLTALLRRALKNDGEFCRLEEELEFIRNYLDIEKARFEERLTVEIDVPERMMSATIPSLIIQPLVENSIKHAISKNGSGGTLSVSADHFGDRIVIVVSDTGAGRRSVSGAHGEGIGLKNVRERLENHYGQDAVLSVSISESGSEARIELPVSAAMPALQPEKAASGRRPVV